ncbi:TlpA family protein disulfide reductase [Paenibacillus elgii]|uniref:TlpA family protein disulfide reductase n=1 Tax=Paenibacillus elgii TaxID=189691 RepID=UPI000248C07D|nr:hypothetical protein [Paenibacillus elgii]
MELLFPILLAIPLFSQQLLSYQACRKEVNHFADQVVSFAFLKLKSFIGMNLREYFPFPSDDEAPAIVMFASPSCDVCHHELEKLLALKQKTGFSIPILCFVEREDRNYETFIQEFDNRLPLLPAEKETLIELQISSFPSFFIVDSNGIIRYPGKFIKEIISVLQDKRKIAKYGIQ